MRAATIDRLVARVAAATAGRTFTVMEVCGTHTHALGSSGLRQRLAPYLRLLSGPGCPVCVTGDGYLQSAVTAARRGWTIMTFGDMVRVPGPAGSLQDARAAGADIVIVYSPLDALRLAQEHPDKKCLFLAVGFETTAPVIAAVVQETAEQGTENLKFLCDLKLVPPALTALLGADDIELDGLLCPGHVSAIIGEGPYRAAAVRYNLPMVIGGFAAEDVALALAELAEMIAARNYAVANAYRRVVRPDGNPTAQALLEKVFVPADAVWRGLGSIPRSGLRLAPAYAWLALAAAEPDLDPPPVVEAATACRCGDVLKGKMIPPECPQYGTACTPERPLGPCMVSAEGSCAAWYKYEG